MIAAIILTGLIVSVLIYVAVNLHQKAVEKFERNWFRGECYVVLYSLMAAAFSFIVYMAAIVIVYFLKNAM